MKINQRLYCCNYMFLYQFIFPVGMNSYCFPPFYPALVSGAQRKAKKDSLRALRLCGENKTLYVIVFKNICTWPSGAYSKTFVTVQVGCILCNMMG